MNQAEINYTQEQLMKIIESQNLGSVEEINDFLAKNITGQYIPTLLEKFNPEMSDKQKADKLAVEASRASGKIAQELIEEALLLDPENVRAWTRKGVITGSAEVGYECLKKAYDYGKKELGEEYFIESKGHFWGLPETRPFMEAAFNLADSLVMLKKFDEAHEIYSEILELNPGDNQGVRYTAGMLMLIMGKFSEFAKLAKEYGGDTSAFWLYNKVFYYFLREGNSKRAKEALKAARKKNKYIFQILTAQREVGPLPSDYYSLGSVDEANVYVLENYNFWSAKPAALHWLMSQANK